MSRVKPSRKQRRKRHGMKLKQLTLSECGWKISPAQRPRVDVARCASVEPAAVEEPAVRSLHPDFQSWMRLSASARMRSVLQVPTNETCAVAELADLDARIDERLIAESGLWAALGPRSSISDAKRLLRWLRLSKETVEDVLAKRMLHFCAPAVGA